MLVVGVVDREGSGRGGHGPVLDIPSSLSSVTDRALPISICTSLSYVSEKVVLLSDLECSGLSFRDRVLVTFYGS